MINFINSLSEVINVNFLQCLNDAISGDITRIVVMGDTYSNDILKDFKKSFPNSYIYITSSNKQGKKNNITNMKLNNVDASKKMNDNSIDLLYINMDISEEEVKAWIPKLKKGGVISSANQTNKDYFKKPIQNEQGWFFVK